MYNYSLHLLRIGQDKVFFRLQLLDSECSNMYVFKLDIKKDYLGWSWMTKEDLVFWSSLKLETQKTFIVYESLTLMQVKPCFHNTLKLCFSIVWTVSLLEWLPIAHYCHLKSHVHGIGTGTWNLAWHFKKTNVLFDHHYILLPVSNKISNSTQFVYTLAQTNMRPVKAQLFATINNAKTWGIEKLKSLSVNQRKSKFLSKVPNSQFKNGE